MTKKQEPQMMICPNPYAKECTILFGKCPYKKPHRWSRACAEAHSPTCPACIEYVEPQPAYECTAPEMQGVCLAIIPNEEHCKECTSWQPKKPATKTSRDARFRSMERFLSPTLNLGERLPPQPEEPAGLKPEPKCNASFCNSKMNGYCTTPNECGFKVKPEPTCPECGHTIASHCKAGCCAEGIAGAFCDCLKAPADLQPEKHCTDSRSRRWIGEAR